jgi:hypothetical protein
MSELVVVTFARIATVDGVPYFPSDVAGFPASVASDLISSGVASMVSAPSEEQAPGDVGAPLPGEPVPAGEATS